MNGVTPAHNTEQYEMAEVIRTLDPAHPEEAPRLADVAEPLIFATVCLIALLAFVGWLLFF